MSIQHIASTQMSNGAGKFSVEPPKGGRAATKLKPLDLAGTKYAWFDARAIEPGPGGDAVLAALKTLAVAAVIVAPESLDRAPEGTKVVTLLTAPPSDALLDRINARADVVVVDAALVESGWLDGARARIRPRVGAYVNVTDAASLETATRYARSMPLLVTDFREETKIPLEIVLAEAQNFGCEVLMFVHDAREAEVVYGVLECGARGVIFSARDTAGLYAMNDAVVSAGSTQAIALVELSIVKTMHVGMGDRACVDLTSYLGTDEGIVLGCFSSGGILACSETHPLPYMPTRPFRVNAGALQMYALAPNDRTWYLSDLRAGMEVVAVSTTGKARRVTVGRVKIERRPMLYIEASAPDGTIVTSIMQEDWHVRVFGDDGQPRNITRLRPGDKVLGHTMDPGRHVGVKVDELIIEQ